MNSRRNPLLLCGFLLLLATTAGCRTVYTTFNPYPRIAVRDFNVTPRIAGRVTPESLAALKTAAIRHLQSLGKFQAVVDAAQGGPDCVFVQGTVHAYRPHRMGMRAVQIFTGIDRRGESRIYYQFTDVNGVPLLNSWEYARYLVVPNGVNASAEAAAAELARRVSWHKNMHVVAVR
ncbi:MAG: hypothetical protein ACYTHM_25740 [Planctomycetota bacterium]|jgi:hypothetical protein